MREADELALLLQQIGDVVLHCLGLGGARQVVPLEKGGALLHVRPRLPLLELLGALLHLLGLALDGAGVEDHHLPLLGRQLRQHLRLEAADEARPASRKPSSDTVLICQV